VQALGASRRVRGPLLQEVQGLQRTELLLSQRLHQHLFGRQALLQLLAFLLRELAQPTNAGAGADRDSKHHPGCRPDRVHVLKKRWTAARLPTTPNKQPAATSSTITRPLGSGCVAARSATNETRGRNFGPRMRAMEANPSDAAEAPIRP